MLEKNKAAHLIAGLLALALAFIIIVGLASAQTPTPTPAETTLAARPFGQIGTHPTPTPAETTPSEDGQPISHTLIGRTHCLKCHGEGFGDASIIPTDHVGYTNDDCQDCHEPSVDAALIPALPPGGVPAPIDHPPAEGMNSCFDCHILLDEKHEEISEAWQESVHGQAKIGCVGCHGGDPRTDEMNLSMIPEAGFIGAPARELVPDICGGCHSDVERMGQYNLPTDQYTKYIESVHGSKLLEEGDTQVALCTDCHGTHDIKKGIEAKTTRQ